MKNSDPRRFLLIIVVLLSLAAAVRTQTEPPIGRTGHAGTIKALALSPDGKLVASGGDDGTVRIWELASGREIVVLKKTKESEDEADPLVNAVSFSPDGILLAAAFDSGIRIWSVQDWKLTDTLSDSTANIDFLAFSPDSKFLATAERRPAFKLDIEGIDTTPDIEIWDLGSGSVSRTIARVYGPVAFNHDGRLLVFAADDGSVLFQDLESDDDPAGAKVKDDGDSVAALSFDKKGEYLYSLTDNGEPLSGDIRVWRTADRKLVAMLKPQSNGAVVPMPDGTGLLIVREMFSPSSLAVINSKTGEPISEIERETVNVQAPVVVSADGQMIVSVDKNGHDIQVIDAGVPKKIRTLNGHSINVTSLAFSGDGKEIIAGYDDERLVRWDAGTGSVRKLVGDSRSYIPFSSGTGTAIVSPNGRYYLTESSQYDVFDALSGQSVATGLSNTTNVNVSFAPDGKSVVFAESSALRIHDASTGKRVKRIALVGAKQNDLAVGTLSPDGKTVAVLGPTLTLRTVATGAVRRSIPGGVIKNALVRNMAFSPDGKYLVVGQWADSHQLDVYSTVTGRRVFKLADTSEHFAISPDGKTIATASDTATLQFVDIATGKIRLATETTIPSGDSTYHFAYSPDGKFLAIGSSGGITLVNSADGSLISRMQ